MGMEEEGVVEEEDMDMDMDMGSEGNIQCPNHPPLKNNNNNNNNPGGICAFCLQEKLGKLVSSSLSTAIFPSSSSSPPSLRSELGSCAGAPVSSKIINPQITTNTTSITTTTTTTNNVKRGKMAFILAHNKKKKNGNAGGGGPANFRRSKSTANPGVGVDPDGISPRRRRFWSFLHLSKHSNSNATKSDKPFIRESISAAPSSNVRTAVQTEKSREKKEETMAVEENNVGRKVSRSRSVGCGSRSFSGDILERISTGLGDCTLRRVESQREGKPRTSTAARTGGGGQDCMKERVKCGGIFGGFTINSSSSSSSSSSHWVSSSNEENVNSRKPGTGTGTGPGPVSHGRNSKGSWGWAFASPMRAFAKTTPSTTTEGSNKNKKNNTITPNLAAIPSLLAARG